MSIKISKSYGSLTINIGTEEMGNIPLLGAIGTFILTHSVEKAFAVGIFGLIMELTTLLAIIPVLGVYLQHEAMLYLMEILPEFVQIPGRVCFMVDAYYWIFTIVGIITTITVILGLIGDRR